MTEIIYGPTTVKPRDGFNIGPDFWLIERPDGCFDLVKGNPLNVEPLSEKEALKLPASPAVSS